VTGFPGSVPKPLSQIEPGTECLRGTSWKVLDRWQLSERGTYYLVWWRGQDEPVKFQSEPTLATWPANMDHAQAS
jgi:hypothetical protein